GDHQPPPAAASDWSTDQPCWTRHGDDHQHARRAGSCAPGADPYCRLLCHPARNCGAVDRSRPMVPHPQSRPHQVPQRPPTRPATTPTGGLTRHAKVEPTPSMADVVRLQLPDLGSKMPRWGTDGSSPVASSGESGEIHERACRAEVWTHPVHRKPAMTLVPRPGFVSID